MNQHPLFALLLCVLSACLSATPSYAEQPPAPSAPPPADEAEEVLVVGKKLNQSHVYININRKTRAVRCRPKNAKVDPIYANLKCEAARRCALVEPYSRSNVRQCLEGMRSQIAAEYVKARRAQASSSLSQ